MPVTFWNALNGCLKEQYDDLMDGYEISAICIDDTQRKIIIGDVTGRIRVFNSMSGMQRSSTASSGKANDGRKDVS